MNGHDLCEESKQLVKLYSTRERSAESIAYEIWDRKLEPQELNPSVHDVIIWCKQLGLAIPS